MQAAAVCLGAAFPLPAMLPSVHWAVWKSWHASDERLEQMDVALAVGTVACVGATVVPPPPGTTTVTPYPLPPPTRPDVQALKFSEHWLRATVQAALSENVVGMYGNAK
ncbi:hypothetical protein MGN70_002866 [Eutypa lata]|nr:hypothetical protein MGN70_002866 [Eutypa lata]